MMPFLLLLLFSQDNRPHEIAKIQREIQILNLVNGLELSEYQMEFILEKAKEEKKIREDFQEKIEENEEHVLTTFNQLKENRIEDGVIPNSLKKRVHYTSSRLQDEKMEMSESIDAIVQEVENVLEGNQIYALEHYVACLIPPPGKSRIGQSEKLLGLTKQLARIREIPDWIYATKKYEIADKAVEKIKRHLPAGTMFNEYAEQQRILDLFDEIRGISDVDFVLKEEEYVERIKGDYFPEKIPVNLTAKIERFLLNPLIIPILEEKLESR